MPYTIKKVATTKDGYPRFKLFKKGTKKTFSNKPMPLRKVIAQRQAIAIHMQRPWGHRPIAWKKSKNLYYLI